MVEVFVDSTDTLLKDLNRLASPEEPKGRLRENVTTFMKDAIEFGLPPEAYNAILKDLVRTPGDRLALPHLRPSPGLGRGRFASQII